tara:strand:+ start:11527 stop:12339 length:813 start_codon:yes stop_codon:yes gene_type:complete
MKNYKHPNDRGYTNPELFVTTDWLEDNINNPNLQIVDVDSPEEYSIGHIPGSSNPIDNFYKTSLKDRTHIQSPEIFSETMSKLGIDNSTQVICYDRSAGLYAFRLIWALHYHGHKNVKFLDGGFPKWVHEDRKVTTIKPYIESKVFNTKIDTNIFADKNFILKNFDDKSTIILDVRSDDERIGVNLRGGSRGGKIPGSVHIEWKNFHTTGNIPILKSAEEIRKILSEKNITTDKNIITYCQGGIRAAHSFWALKLSGYYNVKNYDGSFQI